MAPVPFRGKTCTPQYIPTIAAQIATTKGVSVDQVLTAARANTKRIYGF